MSVSSKLVSSQKLPAFPSAQSSSGLFSCFQSQACSITDFSLRLTGKWLMWLDQAPKSPAFWFGQLTSNLNYIYKIPLPGHRGHNQGTMSHVLHSLMGKSRKVCTPGGNLRGHPTFTPTIPQRLAFCQVLQQEILEGGLKTGRQTGSFSGSSGSERRDLGRGSSFSKTQPSASPPALELGQLS